MSVKLRFLASLVAGGVVAGAVTAAADVGKVPQAVPDDPYVTVTVAGVTVSVDPATGRLREPTPAETRKLSEALRALFRSAPDVQPVVHPNGMVAIELPESYMDFAVVGLDPFGGHFLDCVRGIDAANAWVEVHDAFGGARFETGPARGFGAHDHAGVLKPIHPAAGRWSPPLEEE